MSARALVGLGLLLALGCGHTPSASATSRRDPAPPAELEAPASPRPFDAPRSSQARPGPGRSRVERTADPVASGQRPWWSELSTGSYTLERSSEPAANKVWDLAVGRSSGHHHPAEGLLEAKVQARLALERELEGDDAPLVLLDLFLTPEGILLALTGRRRAAPVDAPPLEAPPSVVADGPHLVGPHRFHDDRHLYLECDVEGPLANPSWGTRQVLARIQLPENP